MIILFGLLLVVAAAVWLLGWCLGVLALRDELLRDSQSPIFEPLFGYGFWPVALVTIPAYGWWEFLRAEEIV